MQPLDHTPAPPMGRRRRKRSNTKSKQLKKLQGGLGLGEHGGKLCEEALKDDAVEEDGEVGTTGLGEGLDPIAINSSIYCNTTSSVEDVAKDTCITISFNSRPNSATMRPSSARMALTKSLIIAVTTKAKILGKTTISKPRPKVQKPYRLQTQCHMNCFPHRQSANRLRFHCW